MGLYYPPVLDKRADSILYKASFTISDTFDIYFQMPGMNDAASLVSKGHIQVVIKNQGNNEPAVNNMYSPDQSVIYFNASLTQYFSDEGGGVWKLTLPYKIFANNKGPQGDKIYTIQIRFGDSKTWSTTASNPNPDDLSVANFTNFATWRQNQTTHVPSQFGEWSNVQTVYCYKAYTVNHSYNYNDFIPEIVFTYQTEGNDPISQIQILYYFQTLNEVTIKTQTFDGNMASSDTYELRAKLPVAPWQPIHISISGVTVNNTWVGVDGGFDIPPLLVTTNFRSLGGLIENLEILGDELEDGVIGKKFTLIDYPVAPATNYFNIYRVDLMDFSTIKIGTDVPILFESSICEIKDYSVEPGAHYRYLACGLDKDKKVINYLSTPPLLDAGYSKGCDGRLMHMESSFLDSRYHQLRLIGNMSVSNFKTNVADAFQTTIGDPYPFYQRNSKVNYRTLQINAAISINFDNTSTFIRLDTDNGLYWENDELISGDRDSIEERRKEYDKQIDTLNKARLALITTLNPSDPNYDSEVKEINTMYEKKINDVKERLLMAERNGVLIVEDIDIFTKENWSLSRRRMGKSNNPNNPTIATLGKENSELAPGSEDSSYLKGPKTIFNEHLEEDFSKNYGTEQRDNLIYLERKFREYVMKWLSNGKPKLYRSETEGNMIVIVSDVSFSPLDGTQRMIYSMSATLTEIAEYNLENLLEYNLLPIEVIPNYDYRNEYNFNPGEFDPEVYAELMYLHYSSFDIPDTKRNTSITPIDTYFAVINGTSPYTFSKVSATSLPAGLSINASTGIISGTPSVKNLTPSWGIVQVRDSTGKTARMYFLIGAIYDPITYGTFAPLNSSYTNVPIIPFETANTVTGGLDPIYFQSTDLPPGININRETGVVSGQFTMQVLSGVANLTAIDSAGQSATSPLIYGDAIYPIIFTDDPDCNLKQLEVNTPLPNTRINPTYLIGGNVHYGRPDITQAASHTYGYSFTASSLPAGLYCDPDTGVIYGTPTATSPGGTITITATDYDTPRQSASTTITYQAILPEFTFRWGPARQLLGANTDGSYEQGIIIAPVDMMRLLTPGSDPPVYYPAVVGGAPWTSGPKYKFRVDKDYPLRPNFELTEAGVISGVTNYSKPETLVKFYAKDSRGKEIPIAANIRFGAVNNGLSYPFKSSYNIPQRLVNTPIAGYNTEATGGLLPYTFSEGEGPYRLPPGIVINPTTGRVSGTPTTIRLESYTARLIVRDSSSPQLMAYVNITVGEIIGILNWPGTFTIPDTERNTPITPIDTKLNIVGGLGPFTFSINSAYPGDRFPEGITLNMDGTISGTPTELKTTVTTVHIQVSDASQIPQIAYTTVQINKVYGGLEMTFTNSLEDVPMILGKSTVPSTQIVSATGGIGPYTFSINWPAGMAPDPANLSVIFPGVQLSSTGYISGAPTALSRWMNIGRYIVVTDTATGATAQAGIRQSWGTPNVYEAMTKFNGDTTFAPYSIGSLQVDVVWGEGFPYIDVKDFPGAAQTTTPLTNNFQFNNWCLSARPSTASAAFSISITATTPAFAPYTPAQNNTLVVNCEGISSNLVYRPVPIDLNIPAIINGTAMTPLNVRNGAAGGLGTYHFTITSGVLPTGITLGLLTGIISGTSSQILPSGSIEITCTDESLPVQSQSIIIPFNGSYAPLVYTGSYNIPSYPINTTITAINTLPGVSGGRLTYSFSADDNLLPYSIDQFTGIISGNSEASSFNQRTTTLTVTDLNGNTASMNITVGAIIGPLSLNPTPDQDIISYQVDQIITPINMALVTSGGTSPYHFTATNLPAALSISDAGIISGKITQATDRGQATITVTDSVGATVSNIINFGIQFGPLVFTAKPLTTSFNIPDQETNKDIPLIYTAIGVAGGQGPYTFDTVTGAGLGPYTISADGVISGNSGPTPAAGHSATLRVTDSVNNSTTLTITVGKIYPPIVITLQNSMENTPLLKRGSADTADPSNITPPLAIISATGGSGTGYRFSRINNLITTQQIIPGITLGNTTGAISGVPTEVASSQDIGYQFVVTDSEGHTAQSSGTWYTPPVYDSVNTSDGQSTTITRNVGWYVQGVNQTGTDYLIGGIPTSNEVIVSGTIFTGMSFSTATGVISGASTEVTGSSPGDNSQTVGIPRIITIRRTSPASTYTESRTLSITIVYEGVVAPLTQVATLSIQGSSFFYSPVLYSNVMLSDIPRDDTNWYAAGPYNYYINMIGCYSGGLRPLTFQLKEATPPGWVIAENNGIQTGYIYMNDTSTPTNRDGGTANFLIRDQLNNAFEPVLNYPRRVIRLRRNGTRNSPISDDGRILGPNATNGQPAYNLSIAISDGATATSPYGYTGGVTPFSYTGSVDTAGQINSLSFSAGTFYFNLYGYGNAYNYPTIITPVQSNYNLLATVTDGVGQTTTGVHITGSSSGFTT